MMDFVFTNPVFQNYTMKNGLLSNYCADILQDKNGYIWVASLNGLSKFNGTKWQHFLEQSIQTKHQLPSNWVIDIDEDDAGNIWINTNKGIAKYNTLEDSIIKYSEPIKGWGKICSINTHSLFVLSWGGIDLCKEENNRLTLVKHYNQSENNSFLNVFKTKNNSIWICPEDNPSLMTLDEKNVYKHFRTIGLKKGIDSIIVNSVSYYSDDTLLLNTKSHGLLKYNVLTNKAISFAPFILLNNIEYNCSVIYTLGKEQYVFVGTVNQGLFVINLKTQDSYHYTSDLNNPTSILSNHINALCLDNNEGIWIGTGAGLTYFHPSLQKNKYFYFYNNSVLPYDSFINTVYKLDKVNYLLGTDNNGLYLTNTSTKETQCIQIKQAEKIKITSILKWTDDFIYIATSKGLYTYNTKSKSITQALINGKPFSESLLRIKLFHNKYLALCSNNGLMLYDVLKNSIVYSELENKIINKEKAYCKDVLLIENELWILRFFNGFEIYNLATKKSVNYTPKEFESQPIDYYNLSHNNLRVFIATTSGIISQSIKNKDDIVVLKTKHGLQGNEIENVCCINDTEVYYTTSVGLYNYNIRKSSSKVILLYENYIRKWHNQLEFMYDGSIAYTISNYFIVNHPLLKFKNKKTPAFIIEKILVNNAPYQLNENILDLNYKQNSFSFYLAPLVYPAADKNVYYYKLNKLDTTLKASYNGEINLYNLPPDDYTLTIFSKNNEDFQSTNTKIIYITIHKAFYNTWWFYSCILLVVAFIIGLFFWYKQQQQQRLVAIRNQISRDLHDELGANVSSINIMAQMLLAKNETQNPVLKNISKYSVQISDNINDIIWNVNPKFDSINELIKKMTRYASEILDGAGITYVFDIPTLKKQLKVDNQIKYHLYLIFKEAINNAAKYSKATLINISIIQQDTYFKFTIKDNGIGFNEAEVENGNGLSNMRMRAKEIKADISIATTQGVEIKLQIKLG